MKIIDCVEVVVERVKRESKELKMRFTNYERVRWKNGRFFFPTFVSRI